MTSHILGRERKEEEEEEGEEEGEREEEEEEEVEAEVYVGGRVYDTTIYHTYTVRLEKLFPFCSRCTFLKWCDRLHSVPFYYRSLFRFITVLRFVSFAVCV